MTLATFLRRTLFYHWRTNLAVLLGVVAGTAVVGGALVVGDSVRGSLRAITLVRLGHIDEVLTGPRFFREELAADLSAAEQFSERFVAAPAIVLQASLEKPGAEPGKTAARAGKVNLYGLDDRAWKLTDHGDVSAPADTDVILSHGLAQQLAVRPGDEVRLVVELPSDIPRDALLGKRDETAVQIPLMVKTVLDESSGVGRLGLHPDQQLPPNAFVALTTLQDRLGLASRRATRRDPRRLPARVNTLFVSQTAPFVETAAAASEATGFLTQALQRAWKLDDFHLRIVPDEKIDCLSLESERMILNRPIAAAAQAAADALHAQTSPVLVYIANQMSVVGKHGEAADDGNSPPRYSRYSVVAGLPASTFTDPSAAPFGPYTFVGEKPDRTLADDEILINDWLAADLHAAAGDAVGLTYHVVGSHGELPEVERQFRVKGIVKLAGTIAADRGITPEVRGITDVSSFTEWDAPFPMKRVTPRDDEYWKQYRATPKAFLTLAAAQQMWRSRYGDLTSFRIAPVPDKSLAESQEIFGRRLLETLPPADVGLAFQPVKFQGLKAASGTTDFGGLFIGFSFFLILSAAILIGLLFRLGVERRAANVGLLLATGYTHRQVRTLLLGEGLIVVAVAAVLGLFAAIGYAAVVIHGLTTWWIGAIGTRFLELHISRASPVIGVAISVFVALMAIVWGIRGLWAVSPRGLLAGVTTPPLPAALRRGRGRRARQIAGVLAGLAVAGTVAVVSRLVPEIEAFAGFSWPTIAFFLVGTITLAAGLAFLAGWIDADRAAAVKGHGLAGIARLGIRNAARHRGRTLLSAGLIASATFLIVAIAAGHRNPARELPDRNSGNGGFTLVAESAVPVLYDLNTSEGRKKLGLADNDLDERERQTLHAMRGAFGFRVNPGENASCLNIYQTSQPTILGVPPDMIQQGGFKFVGAGTSHPWALLTDAADDGAIPVFGDKNTLQYSLHVGLGQTLEIRGEDNRPVKVRIAGMFDGSVFQGVLLMAETPFQRLFPSRVGYQYFLLEIPPSDAPALAELLESRLSGFDAERVSERLKSFLAVQNTYLSTFQALGGLGLLLGTIGLATVMLRNVLERRSELALLRAVGFRAGSLAWLVLCENALLLVWGLACGAASALLAMLPHLLTTGADVPWRDVGLILAAVFLAGMLAALFAVRGALRTPVLATLRAE